MRGGDSEIAVGRRSDRDRARDRVRVHRLHLGAVGECPRDRRAAFGLAADDARPRALDEPELEQLAEALVHLRVHGARRDRSDDGVGELPAELLRDLERDRLRSLRVVRAQLDVDERPVELEGQLHAEAAAVVVRAVHGEDGRAVDRGGDELLRLEVCRDEDCGLDSLRGRTGGDRIGEVPGRRAGERRVPELERLGARHRDDAVLERVRRVRRVQLEEELADADRRCEPRRGDERREAGSEARLRRRGHRKERRVTPDVRRACLDLGAGHGPVRRVHRLERPEAARADSDGIEGELGLADATTECGGRHYGYSFRPGLGIRPGLAPRSAGAGCRGVTGPVPSASLDAERDVVPAPVVLALYEMK